VGGGGSVSCEHGNKENRGTLGEGRKWGGR
jgi:hypothetical protein